MPIVICPVCDGKLPCEEDASCVETVPKHVDSNGNDCRGRDHIGFVFPCDPDDPSAERDVATPKPDPRYRNWKSRKDYPSEPPD